MAVSNWTQAATARALQIWDDYKKQHDVSEKRGLSAGIDPVTGRVWFGESSLDIVQQMQADGIDNPLYFIRVGFDYYLRKGGHR
jgi:hypothetical protein